MGKFRVQCYTEMFVHVWRDFVSGVTRKAERDP